MLIIKKGYLKLRSSLLIGLILLSCSAFSQNEDTTTMKRKKARMLFGFDTRHSFVNGQKSKFFGLKVGVELNEKHRLGLGFYGMTDEAYKRNVTLPRSDAEDPSTVSFRLGYTSIFYEYVIFQNKRWEVSTPLHLGAGSINVGYLDTSGTFVPWLEQGVPLVEFSATAQYKIVRWFALGTGLGYRAILTSDRRTKDIFNAPIYLFQMKLLLGEVYRMIFKKNEDDE